MKTRKYYKRYRQKKLKRSEKKGMPDKVVMTTQMLNLIQILLKLQYALYTHTSPPLPDWLTFVSSILWFLPIKERNFQKCHMICVCVSVVATIIEIALRMGRS